MVCYQNVLYVINKDTHSNNNRNSNILGLAKGRMSLIDIRTRLWNVLLLNNDVNVSLTTFMHNLKTTLLQTLLN